MTVQPGRVALTPDDLVWAYGLEINDDNQLMPENMEPPDELEVVGEWVLPQIFHQNMNSHFNNKGKWNNHTWGMIAIFNELQLFLMTFPISFVKELMRPKMNAATINKISLREYVCLLGLTFFMGCFKGISDCCQWFSKEPIIVDKGAPLLIE